MITNVEDSPRKSNEFIQVDCRVQEEDMDMGMVMEISLGALSPHALGKIGSH